MKKIIISIIFVFTLIIGCIGYVALASVDSLNGIEANTEKLIEAERTVVTPSATADNIIEQVYEANGFSEDDRRTDIKLNISTSINRVNSISNVRSSDSINSETNKSYIYDRMLNSIVILTHYRLPTIIFLRQVTHIIPHIVFSRVKIRNQKN